MPPKLVVVVPTFEHLGYALGAVRSLQETTSDFRAVLVDDASKEWDRQKWETWPLAVMHRHRFKKNGGLTRSWNHGLTLAREWGAEYTCCTNSDVLFTPGWFEAMAWALDNGADLVGPLTNAPGHQPKQQVGRHLPQFRVTDEAEYLARQARLLAEKNPRVFTPMKINGFCMLAKTAVWWEGAFSAREVFNPKFKLTKNEDELQGRWKKSGRVTAVVPASLVFHYRGVTRKGATRGREGQGWFRKTK